MAYKQEYKIKILEQMKSNSIREISQQTGISQATLYNWKNKEKKTTNKEKEETIQHNLDTGNEIRLIKMYKDAGNIEKVEELGERFSKNPQIQVQRIKMYKNAGNIEKVEELGERFNQIPQVQALWIDMYKNARNVEKVEELGERFSKNPQVQVAWIKIYVDARNVEKVEELGERFSKNSQVQFQWVKAYVDTGNIEKAEELGEKFKKNVQVQNLLKNQIKVKAKLKEIQNSNNTEKKKETKSSRNTKKLNEKQINFLTGIRAKIYVGTIENSDINIIKENEYILDKKQYYLMQVAVYERLKQRRNALDIVKQMKRENVEVKGLNEIKERLNSKKETIFDFLKWDKLIGWSTEITEQYEQEERKKQQEREGEKKERIEQEQRNKDIKKTEKVELEPKESKIGIINRKITIKTNASNVQIGNDAKQSSKKSKKAKRLDVPIETVGSTISISLKEIIEKINMKYYIGMQYRETQREHSKDYYQLLREIQEMGIEDKKKTMQRMNDLMKKDYIENDRQARYIKKYDKLQSILECSKDNRRAKIELMLVLINEGYREIVKREFPQKDYDFIDKIIKQYYKNSIKPQDAKEQIDDYCI